MRILLTGATGYIAQRLLPVLLHNGHYVICCVRDKSRFNLDRFRSPNLELIQVNFLDQKTLDNPIEEVFRTGKSVELANHTVLISRDGTERHISDSAAPIRDDTGEIQGVVLVFSDVTEAYNNRELLKQSEKLHRDVIEKATDIIYITDRFGRFSFCDRGRNSC